MAQDMSRIPATPKKNLGLAAILAAAFYVNMINFRDGNIISALLVLCLMSLSMYAVMTYKK